MPAILRSQFSPPNISCRSSQLSIAITSSVNLKLFKRSRWFWFPCFPNQVLWMFHLKHMGKYYSQIDNTVESQEDWLFSQEYTRSRGKPRYGVASLVAAPCTKECFSVSARRGIFRPYCAWGGGFLWLASLWSTNNQWLGSRQPLRHVAQFVALSTLSEKRLPHRTSACLCLKCIPALFLFIINITSPALPILSSLVSKYASLPMQSMWSGLSTRKWFIHCVGFFKDLCSKPTHTYKPCLERMNSCEKRE